MNILENIKYYAATSESRIAIKSGDSVLTYNSWRNILTGLLRGLIGTLVATRFLLLYMGIRIHIWLCAF